jgi:hypothetical protein
MSKLVLDERAVTFPISNASFNNEPPPMMLSSGEGGSD